MAVAATGAALRRIQAQTGRMMLVRSHRVAATAATGKSPSVVTRCFRNASSPSSSSSFTSSAPSFTLSGGGGGASAAWLTARRSLTVSRAIPKKAASSYEYDPVRLRASDEFVEGADDEDEDPLMHMGRPNRSALKRLMEEYKELTKVLCELPKSSISKIPMPEEVREEIYATIRISSNIARKRSEGRVTKMLRNLEDDEVLPIQRAVENLQAGVGLLTVTPEVEEAATRWRELLMAGDKETQSAVFGLMQESETWQFTRQELGQLVTSARKEKEEAEAARAAAAQQIQEAEAEATVMADGTVVPSADAPPTGKRKKGGAGKSTKALLKRLRQIAELASDKGML